MNQAQSSTTDGPPKGIKFHIADRNNIRVEAFLIEETGYKSGEKSEDQITADSLNRCTGLWQELPDPRFLLHDVLPLDTFPDHTVSAKLSSREESVSVVFHCDYRGEGVKELMEVYLQRMSWSVIVGIDQDEVERVEKRWFGWMGEEPPF